MIRPRQTCLVTVHKTRFSIIFTEGGEGFGQIFTYENLRFNTQETVQKAAFKLIFLDF